MVADVEQAVKEPGNQQFREEEVRVGRGLETEDEAGHKVSWIEYCVVKVLFELKIFEEFRVFCPRNSFRKLTIQLEWKERKDQCVK